ncbi:UNVERIFIED_CONTAM: Flotillin-1, partial [Eudyptes pachyrhynchus]
QEIYKDRQKFSEQVFNVASSDLVNMGISVVSYTLKDIHDDQVAPGGDMGGDTVGTRWGHRCQRGQLHPEGHPRRPGGTGGGHGGGHGGDTGVSVVSCTLKDVARTKQQIEEQRAQVLVVERAQQAQLQEHEIGRRERELEATVRKPAEAERYRLERLAEAQR